MLGGLYILSDPGMPQNGAGGPRNSCRGKDLEDRKIAPAAH